MGSAPPDTIEPFVLHLSATVTSAQGVSSCAVVILLSLVFAANSLRPANKYSTIGQDSQATDIAGVPQQNVANASSFPVLMSHHYSSRDSEAVFIMSMCTSNHRWDGVALTKAQKSIVAVEVDGAPKSSYVEPDVTIQWQTNERQMVQVCQVDRWDQVLFTIVCPKVGHESTATLSMYAGSERVEVWDGVHVNIDRDAVPKRKVQVCTMDGAPGTENVDRLLNHAAYYNAIGVDSVRMYYRGGWGEPGFEEYLDSHLRRVSKATRIKMSNELAAWIKSGKLELVYWNPSWEMTPRNDAWKAPEPANCECAGDGPAYLDCLYMAKGSVDWLGVVQQDEFYHIRKKPLQDMLASIPPDVEYLAYTLYEWNATNEGGRRPTNATNYLTAENVLRSPEIGADGGTLWGALVRPRSAVAMGAQGATLSSAGAVGRWLDPQEELVMEHFTWHPNYRISRDIRVNTTAVNVLSLKDQAPTLSQTELSDSRRLKYQPYTAWKEEWAAKVAAVRNQIRNMYM